MGKGFSNNGNEVAGTGQTVGDLRNAIDPTTGKGWSNAQIAQMDPNALSTPGGNLLKSTIAGGLKGMQQGQQRPGGYAQPIQVTPTPDVSGYYQQKPLNPADPYSAFYGR